MKTKTFISLIIVSLLTSLYLVAGCSNTPGSDLDPDPEQPTIGSDTEQPTLFPDIFIDVGGAVLLDDDDNYYFQEPLEGVNVTFTDSSERESVTTTNDYGLWTISNLSPGTYSVSYTKNGFRTSTFIEELTIQDWEVNVGNIYIDFGVVNLYEIGISATLNISNETIDVYNNTSIDGLGGAVNVYNNASNTDIIVTFDKPIYPYWAGNTSEVRLTEFDGWTTLAYLTQTNETTFSITDAELDALNGTTGLTADNDDQTLYGLRIWVTSYTSIYAIQTSLYGVVFFNVEP